MTTLQQILDDLDPKSIDMLRAIAENSGEATTPEIRNVTGLSNSQVAYRRDKLRDCGLIEVRTGEPTGSRTPPKSHSLTAAGQSHIDAGLFELSNPPVTSDVEQVSTQVNHLRDRVDDLTEAVDRLNESIENMSTDLNERVGTDAEFREATDGVTMASAMIALQTDLEELQEEVAELEERKKNKLFG